MSDAKVLTEFEKALNKFLGLPQSEIPKDFRGLVDGLRSTAIASSPNKKRGRPKNLDSKFARVFLYAWFTLNMPDSGKLRVNGYRRELDGWILEALLISENQLNRSKTIWNSYLKNDLETYLSIIQVYLDDNDVIGSRITTIEGLRAMQYDVALLLFPHWVEAAIAKYG